MVVTGGRKKFLCREFYMCELYDCAMRCVNGETVQEHVYNTTVPATCLPHTGFAGVWTPATHAELTSHRTIHKHGLCERCYR